MAANQPGYAGATFARTVSLHLAFGLLLLVYAGLLVRMRRLPSSLPFDGALVLVLTAIAISALTSINIGISSEAALLQIAVVVLLYALADFKVLTAERLAATLVISTVLLCLAALAGGFFQVERWWGLSSAVDGSITWLPPSPPRDGGFLHPNVLAMVINLALPFAFLALIRGKRPWVRFVAGLAVLVLLLGLLVTQSRGGWLAMIAGLTLFALVYRLSTKEGVVGALCGLPWRRVALGGAVATLMLLAGAVQTWRAHPSWLFRDTLSPRLEAATKAVEIFEDRPLVGTGANTYGLRYVAYGGETIPPVPHPHNAYLNVLVDSGIAGALLLLTAGGLFVAWFVKAYLLVPPEDRLILAACAGALVSLPVHGLVDSPQLWTPVLVAVVIVVTIALRTAPTRESSPRGFSLVPKLLVVSLVPLLLVGWLSFDLPFSRYDRSQDLLVHGSIEDASREASGAASSWAATTGSHLNAGIIAGLLYQEEPTDAHYEAAVRELRAAIATDPNSSVAFANLALLELAQGETGRAVEDAETATRKARHDPVIAAVAGSVFEVAGEVDKAVEAYAIAVGGEPRLTQSLFWQAPDRAAMRQNVIVAAGLNACDQGVAFVLYGVYDDDLQGLLDSCTAQTLESRASADDRAAEVVMMAALGRTTEAMVAAAELERDAPNVTSTRLAMAVALSDRGDLGEVRSQLLRAAVRGNRDAGMLLSYTYGGDVVGTNRVSRAFSIVANQEPLPAAIRKMIDAARSPSAGFAKLADYRTEEKYFEIHLLRSAPSIILLPGEWQKLVSPREARLDEIMAATR